MTTRAARRDEFRRIAPRLERAHRDRREELAAESRERVAAAQAVLKAQRLIAHRELQLLRGGARLTTRKKRAEYVDERTTKLDAAYKELDAARARAARAGLPDRPG